MNKQETIKIIAILKIAYPKFFISNDETETKLQIDTWQDLFANEPYKLVEQAVKTLMCTLKFPPTIADVKEKIFLITQPEQLTEMEAWRIVRNAISYYGASESFASLPLTIQKVVSSSNQLREWAVMESDVVDSVIQSNFMRSFKARQQQEKERSMLPESTRQLITSLNERMGLTDGSN